MHHYYLAFDYGTKFIGVAVGQDVTRTARPLTTLHSLHRLPDWLAIKKIIQQWSPQALIVGIPQEMQEKNQWITTAAQQFAGQLAQQYTACSVHTVDERLSTLAAKEVLFNRGGRRALEKSAIDAMAAAMILETWLQSTLVGGQSPPNSLNQAV